MDEIYRLHPLSPLHLGERGVGMEESGESIQSDTLFSALCWAVREVEGSGWLDEWLGAFLNGPAPLLLTSAFPLAGDVRFYPRPMLPPPWGPAPAPPPRRQGASPGRPLQGRRSGCGGGGVGLKAKRVPACVAACAFSGALVTAGMPFGVSMERSKGTLKLGSSKQGKARRASVASNCVNAYQRSPSLTR